MSFTVLACAAALPGQQGAGPDAPPPASQPATEPADASSATQPAKRKGYPTPKAISAKRDGEPPSYVQPLSEKGWPGTEKIDWLLFGVEHRTRLETRDDNYREGLNDDTWFLMRSRTYLGVQKILDPLRLGVEFQDSREFGSAVPWRTGHVDEYDFIQGFAELYFKDVFGEGEPLRLQAGRMAIDYVDRRLRTRNGFRNTTNAFDGFRLHVGEQESLWEFDVFAVQPVAIRPVKFDHPDEERWFYGVTGTYRRWPKAAILEPYYFVLDGDFKGWHARNAEIHTLGLHAYAPIGDTGFDYDVDVAYQWGPNRGREQRAFATHAELGYTFQPTWEPRLAAWVNYASGDRDPNDDISERFDPLFGSSTGFFGHNEYFNWQNVINPAVEFRLQPTKKTRLQAIYRTYWLASDTDSWGRAGRRDRTGRSGDFVGQAIDLVARHSVTDHITIEAGYAHFFAGPYVRHTGDSPDSDMFFVQTTLKF